MTGLPGGTVTFLFTDIQSSSRLWEQFPDAMKTALELHDRLLRQAIESHRGYIFKTVGDAFCAAFETAPDALAAAVRLQRAILSASWGKTGPLHVREALHTGTAEERGGDYFGSPLNRVSRLLAVGHGGQILLSLAAEELVRDYLPGDITLIDLGEHQLRDLVRPERIFQVAAPDLPSDFPPPRSLEAFPNNLPVQITSFIGRERDIVEVTELIGRVRLLTLTGPGGCGKTRLALQVSADLLKHFSDGVWLIDLAPLFDPSLVAQAVASILDIHEEPCCSFDTTLTGHLKSREMLLVLDNCEHLIAAVARLCDHLLKGCPHLKMLVTSREALGIAGETAWNVPTLSLPDTVHLPSLEKTTRYEAVRLFIDRATAVRPDFRVTNENASAVAQVCYRLDGIPLAIELAAARVKVLSVEEIASRLDDRFHLLTGGSRTALPRQQTLRTLVDWSYDLLNDIEKMLLRRLSVFTGGWSMEAARVICSGGILEEWDVLDVLTQLVDKSLVVAERQRERTRYRLLETMCRYSRDRLDESGELPDLRRRHLDYYRTLAEDIAPEESDTGWFDRMEVEHDNLRAALEASLEPDIPPETGLRLAAALERFWRVRGYWMEGRRWLEKMARQNRGGDSNLAAKVLAGAGVLAFSQGDHTAAQDLYEASLNLYRATGYQAGIAKLLAHLGGVAWNVRNYPLARSLYEGCLAIYRELNDRSGIANSVNNLGMVAWGQGDHETARSSFRESLAYYREMRDQQSVALALSELGNLTRDEGDFAAARVLHEESLTLRREIGAKGAISNSLSNLGQVAWDERRYEDAERLLQESLDIRRELGARGGVADALSVLGLVAWSQDDFALARQRLAESLSIFHDLGDRWGIVVCLEGLGRVCGSIREEERAARMFGAAASLRQTIGTPMPSADRADYERAVSLLRSGMEPAAFESAWRQGESVSLEQAVAEALETDRAD